MPLTPKQASADAFARAHAALTHSKTKGLAKDVAEDLGRTALVTAVAALDTYLHAAVLRKVKAWKPKAGVAKLDMRFDLLCTLIREATDARRKNPKTRPWVAVKEALQERLLKMTFQSSRGVEDALAMCGEGGWGDVAKKCGVAVNTLKKRLDRMVHRRNRIVHESDLQREARPQAVKRQDVDVREVARDIKWLEDLVDAIDQVVKP
jgi:hypothetical protein